MSNILNSVLRGASTLVIRSSSVELPKIEVKHSSANDAFREDWKKVGGDIWRSMEKAEEAR